MNGHSPESSATQSRDRSIQRSSRRSGIVLYSRDAVPSDAFALAALDDGSYEPPIAAAAALTAVDDLRVVDLGAYIGTFGAFAFERLGASSVLAYEPDPANAAVHRRTIEANSERDWRLVDACAGTRADMTPFVASGDWNAAISTSGHESIRVAIVDVFDSMGDVTLLKLDIEGGEWDLLRDDRFGAVPVVFLEYHQHRCPVSYCHQEARRMLRRHGYTTQLCRASANGGSLWGWRDRA